MSDAYRDLVERLRAVVPPADGGEVTRQRILRDLPQTKRPVRRMRTVLLLAAAFFVSTAFALYIASPAARDADRATRRVAPAKAPRLPVLQSEAAEADASTPSAAQQSDAAAPASSTAPAAAPAPSARPPRRTTPLSIAPAPPPSTPPAPGVSAPSGVSPEQRRMLYIEAHRQHFRGSPAQALAAWDAFLATNPAGQVLLEAGYNRAVTLLRLGRRNEAAVVLAAFARGEHGGFRQREAQQLLQQLAR